MIYLIAITQLISVSLLIYGTLYFTHSIKEDRKRNGFIILSTGLLLQVYVLLIVIEIMSNK